MTNYQSLTLGTGKATKLKKGDILTYDQRLHTFFIVRNSERVDNRIHFNNNDNKLFVGRLSEESVTIIAKLIAACCGYGIEKIDRDTKGIVRYQFV